MKRFTKVKEALAKRGFNPDDFSCGPHGEEGVELCHDYSDETSYHGSEESAAEYILAGGRVVPPDYKPET